MTFHRNYLIYNACMAFSDLFSPLMFNIMQLFSLICNGTLKLFGRDIDFRRQSTYCRGKCCYFNIGLVLIWYCVVTVCCNIHIKMWAAGVSPSPNPLPPFLFLPFILSLFLLPQRCVVQQTYNNQSELLHTSDWTSSTITNFAFRNTLNDYTLGILAM